MSSGAASSESPAAAHVRGTKPPGQRELTLRALLVAPIVAAIMGAAYPYIVLKIGFGPNVSVVAAFLGYLALGIVFRKTYNRWENNIVQTAGTSAAQTAFMCVLLAAFDILAARDPSLALTVTPLGSFFWLTAAGMLGVLMAIPLRQHYIVDEKLTYADGVAAGSTLIVLDSKGSAGKKAALAMGAGTLASAGHMLMKEEGLLLKWLPDALKLGPALVQKMGVGLAYSLLSLGSGLLVGLRINVSMMIGGLLSWVIAPYLLTGQGWVKTDPTKNDILFWIMWPATGMLVAGGITALALRWRVLVRSFQGLGQLGKSGGDLPLRWIGAGCAVALIALVVVQDRILDMPVWETLVAVGLSVPLMLVGLRVLGETNWGPISALSNMMQVVFGLISPGNVASNMAASGTTGTVAVSSEAIMQDYKAGDMIGSTPRYLAYAQLLAVPIGAAAVSWMYPLLRDMYGIVGDKAQLSSPISQKWAGFAEIMQDGFDALPPHAFEALALFAALGVLFTVLEGKPKLRTWVPSPTGVGIGMLVPFAVVATMAIGGLAGWLWEKKDQKSYDVYSAPLASGLIAGEAIIAVVIPLLVVLGLVAI